ncbi:ATP synthase subunit I [Aliidiomarina maris]|uniref:ATP synthase protein I n=1 Tax=Aliidiomarina maris TaxID=531312 RepID=A0A327WVL4_9GAMM|nr:ATP synthase subunit I [Aliidiomarina maris]MBA3988808.1 hypothetical protein [Idiomarina sp.]MCL5050733.1 ATP synthase subunit I [Bacillota bacterium]RAJ97065.1 ATP synthase protein I [Aliidiomarina maris]RUO24667.1 hypothetical protein CWE07_08350 [Aliidiomarina maris]
MPRPAQTKINAKGRRIAQRLLTIQCIVAVVLISVFGVIAGIQGAINALAGALSGLIPNSIFALLAFKFSGARSAHSVVSSFLAGEALKIMLSMVLLIIALIFLDGPMLPLFIVFATIHMMHLLAPILLLKTN